MNHKKGFTLVELALVAGISSIIAISLSSMMIYMVKITSRGSASISMQRDASVTLEFLSRNLHPASGSDIQITGGTTLTIVDKSFYLAGGSLYFDPDTAIPSNEIIICDNNVSSILFTLNSSTVNVQLVLQQDSETTTINTELMFHN